MRLVNEKEFDLMMAVYEDMEPASDISDDLDEYDWISQLEEEMLLDSF